MKNNYCNITTMEQLREARRELDMRLIVADKKVTEHWERLLDVAEPAHIAARMAKSVFDFVSQAAMVERIYRTLFSFARTLFSNDKTPEKG